MRTSVVDRQDQFLISRPLGTLLKWLVDFNPDMEWMSVALLERIEKLETGYEHLGSSTELDPLNALPPPIRQSLLRMPKIAKPTVALYLMNLFFILVVVAVQEFFGILHGITIVPMLSVACFLMFTVAHDAAHGSLSSSAWINGLFGRISFPFLGPFAVFPMFRWIHHQHHKFTNHPSKDPDRFASHGNVWLLPFKWTLLQGHYLYHYLKNVQHRPVTEVLELVLQVATNVFLMCWLVNHGLTRQLVTYWLLPSFLGQVLLVILFDFIPHWNLEATPAENRYQTTAILQTYSFLQPVLSVLLQYQDYHLIHHLYPQIPFYRYSNKWREKKEYLVEQKQVKINRLKVDLNGLHL